MKNAEIIEKAQSLFFTHGKDTVTVTVFGADEKLITIKDVDAEMLMNEEFFNITILENKNDISNFLKKIL